MYDVALDRRNVVVRLCDHLSVKSNKWSGLESSSCYCSNGRAAVAAWDRSCDLVMYGMV